LREAKDKLSKETELLIADVVMPEVFGTEVALELAKKKENQEVLFITGHTDKLPLVKEVAQRLQAEILLKPFSFDELTQKIERL